MAVLNTLTLILKNQADLTMAYMPFISGGAIFVPTKEDFTLGAHVTLNLQFPGEGSMVFIEGRVVWMTPQNSPHHAYPGIGVQFVGPQAKKIRDRIVSNLDQSLEPGGYVFGALGRQPKKK